MKHNFEERKQNRIDYARKQAAKNNTEAEQLAEAAKKMASVIPFGQPILIGHHSEKRDRNYRDKIHNTYGKSFEKSEKADYYEQKAETIESNHAISSDDPQALDKLKKKLQTLTALQEFMKAANKCIKKQDKEAFLQLPFAKEELWQQLNERDFAGRIGFPSYKLTNNNANIKRIQQRVASLEKLTKRTTSEKTFDGVRLIENTEAGRVQLVFDGKPAEAIRKVLKSNGFRWCPSEMAWQRHLNNQGLYAAKCVIEQLKNVE